MFQLAKGTYYYPAITPTLWCDDDVLGEWHSEHLDLGRMLFRPQLQPYHCCFCGTEIEDRSFIVYGVNGFRPAVGYVRPQHRGYKLQIVSHYGCWYSRKLGWTRTKGVLSRLLDATASEAKNHGC